MKSAFTQTFLHPLMGLHWAISMLLTASFLHTFLAAYYWICGARGFNERILDFTCSLGFWTQGRLLVALFLCAITGLFNYWAGGRPHEGHYSEYWMGIFFVCMAYLMMTTPTDDMA